MVPGDVPTVSEGGADAARHLLGCGIGLKSEFALRSSSGSGSSPLRRQATGDEPMRAEANGASQ